MLRRTRSLPGEQQYTAIRLGIYTIDDHYNRHFCVSRTLAQSTPLAIESMEASLNSSVMWSISANYSRAAMAENKVDGNLQLHLDALWESSDDRIFETRWSVLLESLAGPMRAAIERVSRGRFHRSGKSSDEILVEDAFILSLEKLWKAARKMKDLQLARVLTYGALEKYAYHLSIQSWHAVLRNEKREWNKVYRAVVRVIKTNPDRLAVWRDKFDRNTKVVGFPEWIGLQAAQNQTDIDELCRQAGERVRSDPSAHSGLLLDKHQLCLLLLDVAKGPIRLFELISAITRLEQEVIVPGKIRDPSVPPWTRLYYAETFEACWRAFLKLSIQQRRVMLLKWPELSWFEVYCRVSISTIAAALDLPLDVFLALEPKLPLSDEQIAAITKLKVQNLRNIRVESLKAFRAEIDEILGESSTYILGQPRDWPGLRESEGLDSFESH
jgi:hypothetical protein